MRSNKFDLQSPERVLKQAHEFKQTLHEALPLPNSPNKSMFVSKVADYELDQIKYSINRAQYQNDLFRKLEKADQQHRNKITKSLLLRQNQIEKNATKNLDEVQKKYQLYSKHVNQVHKRYHEEENKKFEHEKQEALKLRKQIKEFYQKQEQRKKLSQQQQVKVSTCYGNALQRIHKIQKANEQFAQKAEIELNKSFIRNSPQKKNELLKLRSTSLDFKKNQQVFLNSQLIFKQRENKFIQKFAKNQTCSLKAFEHKQSDNEKTKKKIQEKLKKDTERWAQQKSRIDEANQQIPQKCTSKMQRSLHTNFRHTFSTFKDSFSKWRVTGEFNRSKIKEKDDKRKDQLMNIHEDITLKNKSVKQIDDKMLSMRQRAIKVANNYL